MPFGTTTIIFPDDHAVIRTLDSSPVYPTTTPNIALTGILERRLDRATERRRARFGTWHGRQVAGGVVAIGEERASQS
jgi:hypothetical protein